MAENKKVLIFGSDGQLGFDLVRVFKQEYNAVGLNRAAVDITQKLAVSEIVDKEKPDIIINAAAYNKVEQAEVEKDEAFKVNSEAVLNIAEAAKKVDAILVHVSTDYVFDGSKDFYVEADLPSPLNNYGASKLAGEENVKKIGGKFYIVRTSSVFGQKQSGQKMNFVDKIIEMAEEGKLLKVVSDQTFSPTYSFDLAVKIKELVETSPAVGFYHITNQGTCSWFEFAKKILEIKGLKNQIEPILAENSGSKVKRPKSSVLKNLALEKSEINLLPSWQDALGRYLAEKSNQT